MSAKFLGKIQIGRIRAVQAVRRNRGRAAAVALAFVFLVGILTPITLISVQASSAVPCSGTSNQAGGPFQGAATDCRAGATAAWNFTVQNPTGAGNAWPGDGRAVITFPPSAGFGLIKANLGAMVLPSEVIEVESVVDSVVTLKRLGLAVTSSAGTQIDILLSGVVNPRIAQTDAITIQLRKSTPDGAIGTLATFTGFQLQPNDLLAVAVSPNPTHVLATGTHTFSFTPTNPWPGGGKLEIVMPGGTEFPGTVTAISTNTGDCVGTGLTVATGTTADAKPKLTITRPSLSTCAAGVPISIAVTGIKSPRQSGGAFTITTQAFSSPNTYPIDTGSGKLALTGLSGTLDPNLATLTPTNPQVAAVTDQEFRFRTSVAWPQNGKFFVRFPAGYDLTTLSNTVDLDGCDGGSFGTPIKTAPEVTFTLLGAPCPAGVLTITFSGIKNPVAAGETAPFFLAIRDPAGTDIQTLSTLTTTILPRTISVSRYTPSTTSKVAASPAISYVLPLGLSDDISSWPTNGKVEIAFPADYTFTGPVIKCGTETFVGAVAGGSTITASRPGGTPATPCTSHRNFTIENVNNPRTAGPTGALSITLTDSESNPIYAGSLPSLINLTPNNTYLQSTSVTGTNYVAGAIADYTFRFTNPTPLPNTGAIAIGFPSGYDAHLATTLAVDSLVNGQTKCIGTFTKSQTTNMVVIVRDAPSDSPACEGNPITITIGGIRNPQVSGPVGLFYMATRDNTGLDLDAAGGATGGLTPGLDPTILTMTPGILVPVTGVAQSNVVNQVTTYTFTFITSNPLPSDAKFLLTFPAGYDLPSTSSAPLVTLSGCTGGIELIEDGPTTLTLQRVVQTATPCDEGTRSLSVSGIRNPTASGPSGTFSVSTFSGQKVIDQPLAGITFPALNLAALEGPFASATVQVDDLDAEAAAKYTFDLEFEEQVPVGGKFAFTFPTGVLQYDLPPGNHLESITGCSGSVANTETLSTIGVIVLTVTQAPCTGPVHVVLKDIKNPTLGGAKTLHVATRNAAGVDLEGSPLQVSVEFLPLTIKGIVAGNNKAGASTTYAVTFTPQQDWLDDDGFRITFPAGFGAANAKLATVAPLVGCTGTFTPESPLFSSSGNSWTIFRKGDGADCAATDITLNLVDVTNPLASGKSGAFSFATLRAGGSIVEQISGVNGPDLLPSGTTLLGVDVDATDTVAGAHTPYTFKFTTTTPWPASGSLRIGFPVGYDASAATFGSISRCAGTGPSILSKTTQSVVIGRGTNAGECGAGPINLVVGNIRNPEKTGPTGTFTVATRNAVGLDLDAHHLETVTIEKGGPLLVSSILPSGFVVNEHKLYTFTFSTTNPWPADGSLKVQFPPDYNLAAISAVQLTGTGGSGSFAAAKDNVAKTVTISRTGTPSEWDDGTKQLLIYNVQNPKRSGLATGFQITTYNGPGLIIDQSELVDGPILVPVLGPFESMTIVTDDPDGPVVEEASMYSFSFDGADWTATRKLVIDFPTDYVLGTISAEFQGCAGTDALDEVVIASINRLTVSRDASPTCTTGPFVVKVTGATNPSLAGAYAFRLALLDAADVEIHAVADIVVDIEPGDLDVSTITSTVKIVGQQSTYGFVIDPTLPFPPDGKIVIIFPLGYDVSGVDPDPLMTISGAFLAVPNEAARAVIIHRVDGAPTSDEFGFSLSKIKNPGASDRNAPFVIVMVNEDFVPIEGAAGLIGPALEPFGGALGVDPVVADDAAAGRASTYWFGFDTFEPWPGEGKFRATFPEDFDISTISAAAFEPASLGTLTILRDLEARTVTLTRTSTSALPPDDYKILIEGVGNPLTPKSALQVGDFGLAIQDAAGRDINAATVAAPAITAGTLAGVGVTIDPFRSTVLDAFSTLTVDFDPTNPWPAGGRVALTAPLGYSFAAAVVDSEQGCDLTIISTVANLLVLEQSSGQAASCATMSQRFSVSGVTNAPTAWSTGFHVQTMLGNVVLEEAAIVGPVLRGTAGTLQELTLDVPPNGFRTGSSSAYSLRFKIPAAWPADGVLRVKLPPELSVGANPSAVIENCGAGTLTAPTAVFGSLEFDRAATSACGANTEVKIVLQAVSNPSTAATIGPIFVAITTASGIDIAAAAVPTVTIQPSEIDITSITTTNPEVAGTGTYTVQFRTTSVWPDEGRLVVNVPSGFNVASATATLGSACTSVLEPVAATTTQAIFRRIGACPANTPLTVTLAGVVNGPNAGVPTGFGITTQDASGRPIDSVSGEQGPALTPLHAALTSVTIIPASQLKGVPTTYTIGFTPSTPIPANGRAVFTFPTGFTLTSPAVTFDCAGTYASSVNQLVVTITRQAASECAGPRVLTITGVTNPSTAGSYVPFLSTQTSAAVDLDVASGLLLRIVPPLEGVDVHPVTDGAGLPSAYSISFTSAAAWPSQGKLAVTFPSEYDVATAGAGTFTCGSTPGSLALLTSGGNTVTVRNTGATCPAASVVTAILTGMRNPLASQTFGPFVVQTKDQFDTLLALGSDTATAIAPSTIAGGSTNLLNPQGGASTTYTFVLPNMVEWPASSKLKIDLGSGVSFDALTVTASGASPSGTFTATAASTLLTIQRTATQPWIHGDKTLAVTGIRSKNIQGPIGPFPATFWTGTDIPIAAGSIAGVTLTQPVDAIPPSAVGTISSVAFLPIAEKWSRNATGTLSWLEPPEDDVNGYLYAIDIDGEPTVGAATTKTVATSLTDLVTVGAGEHTFKVRAKDASGNLGPTSSYSFKVDLAAPTAGAPTATQGLLGCTKEATSTVTWPAGVDTGGSGLARYLVQINSGPETPNTERSISVPLAAARTYVNVSTVDGAGNAAVQRIVLKRDLNPPVLTITAPTYASRPFEITWSATDDCAQVESYVIEWRPATTGDFIPLYQGTLGKYQVPIPDQGDGTLAFRGSASDKAGRTSVASAMTPVTTLFDATVPGAPSSLAATAGSQGSVALKWQPATDSGSGIAGYYVYRSQGAGAPYERLTSALVTGTQHDDLDQGKTQSAEYRYRVTAVDKAGNEGPPAQFASVIVDTRSFAESTAPVLQELAILIGVTQIQDAIRAIDQDSDGRFDSLEDESGAVLLDRTTTIAGASALILRHSGADPTAIWVPSSGEVLPLVSVKGQKTSDEVKGETREVSIRVSKHSGWILAKVDDPHQGRELLRVLTAAGQPIPADRVYRENGKVLFLDDPDVTYTFVYAEASSTLDEPSFTSGKGILWIIAGGALLVVGALTAVLLLRRRRPANAAKELGAPNTEAQPIPSQSAEGPQVADAIAASDEAVDGPDDGTARSASVVLSAGTARMRIAQLKAAKKKLEAARRAKTPKKSPSVRKRARTAAASRASATPKRRTRKNRSR